MKRIWHRFLWLFIILLTGILFLSGCTTVKVVMADKNIGTQDYEDKISKNVLLVVSGEFLDIKYASSQLGTKFEYHLGVKLSNYIEESLKGLFVKVDKMNTEEQRASYDLVIIPELIDFKAEVPATIFQKTKTYIEIKYNINQVDKKENIVISASGSQTSVTEDEINYRKERLKKAPFVPGGGAAGGLVAYMTHAKKYEYSAGVDAELAILHCLNELNRKLKESEVNETRAE